jgi:hypothetical protein
VIPLDVAVEMYLKPVSTGVYDWVTISGVQRNKDIAVTVGNENLNSDPGPGKLAFAVVDPHGDFNRRNPMGIYYGSIGLGVQTRVSLLRVDDPFNNRTQTNTWGPVGNRAADTWTNGSSSGGTVNATDWTVTSGSARHSLPAADAYRVSELSKTTRLFTNCEARLRVKVPTNNVAGTGALATEVWFRTTDVSNYLAVSLAFQIDETLQIAIYDRTAGANRWLLNYTTLPGLSLTTSVDYELRCQAEGSALRAKVWKVGDPEPQDWSVSCSRAAIREGYTSVASFCFPGNTNAKPLVFQYDLFQARLPVSAGEITELKTSGDGNADPKMADIEVADILERIQSGASAAKSVMRRGRAATHRWFYINRCSVSSGDTRTATIANSSVGNTVVGDFFYLLDSTGTRKEDTLFTIRGSAVGGSFTDFTFTPDALETLALGDIIEVHRTSAPASLPVAYWPCEDGDQATQISSGLPGGAPMSISRTTPRFGAESGFPCSAPILEVNDAELVSNIPDYTDSNLKHTITFLLAMPDTDEAATGSDLVQWYTDGTGWSWDLQYTAGGAGSLQLKVFNSALVNLFDSGAIDFGLRGDKCQITVFMQQVGGTVTYGLYKTALDGTVGGVGPNLVTGVTTLGKCLQLRVNPAGGFDNVAFGHIAVIPDLWDNQMSLKDVTGWTGQGALQRLQRLCYEENIALSYHVDWDIITTAMGPQKVDKMSDLIKQPAASDGGFLYAPRGAIGLEYRSRGSLANQDPIATFSVSGRQVLPPFDPIDDHADSHNSVEVTRIDGTTVTAVRDTGPLSTQLPPNGLGTRDDSHTLSLYSDDQTTDHANWRLGLGTIDQPRVPKFVVTAAGAASVGIEKLMSISVGSRVDITGMSTLKDLYDDLQLIVLGYTLRVGRKEFPTLEMNCAPYEVNRAFALTGDDSARPDGYDSYTNASMTTTATSMSVKSLSGIYLWTTTAGDCPFLVNVGGEVMRVSAVVNESSPQTFTVVRSINGVVKTHAADEPVSLAQPNYWQFR